MSFLKEKPRIIPMVMRGCCYPNYTIPRNNRELQPLFLSMTKRSYYTIPRNNRELQQLSRMSSTK